MHELNFTSPIDGEIIPLEEVNDPAISEKMLGEGFAVKPNNGKVLSPVDGVVTAIYPTGHAIGIKSNDGYEFLIHVGVHTFKIQPGQIKINIKPDEHISQNQLLVEFDKDEFESRDIDITTSVLFINREEFSLLKRHQSVTTNDKHLFLISDSHAIL